MLFDKSLYADFETDQVVNEATDKRSRILHICKSLHLNKLIERCISVVDQTSRKHSKSAKSSSCQLEMAKILYDPLEQDTVFTKIINNLSNAIIYAPFGDATFIEAFSLRAKCNLKTSKYSNALYDSEVAIRYGGLNFERILIKSIVLFSLNRHHELKVFLLKNEVAAVEIDTKVEAELNQLGFGHLTIDFLRQFASSYTKRAPQRLIQTNRPGDLDSKLKKLFNFELNYLKDDKVEIVIDSYKGRYMKAKEWIPSGTTILVERSLIVGFEDNRRHQYCLYCRSHCKDQCIPCKYCTDVVFCNESCFENCWKLYHQHECQLISLSDSRSFEAELMYRTIAKVGLWNAFAVHDKIDDLKTDPEIVSKANFAGITPEMVINETIIRSYLRNRSLRTIPSHQQSEEQLIEEYEFHCTMADHNEWYEEFFDVDYMPLAINVAFLLLLNDYLRRRTDSPVKFTQINLDEMEKMLAKNVGKEIEDCLVFDYSIEIFVKLVEILLLNIRKLATNMFGWNSKCIFNCSYIGTCQVLIGSYINHSCDPNVEWSFTNGCISYTTLRDIAQGEEINNSYGPNTAQPFGMCKCSARQMLEWAHETVHAYGLCPELSEGAKGIGSNPGPIAEFILARLKSERLDKDSLGFPLRNYQGKTRMFCCRQTKLANNYCFNCNCSACLIDVLDYSHVLQCTECSGPVAVLADSSCDSTCMVCQRIYEDSADRMFRVNEQRAIFNQLYRYFNQPSVALQRPGRNRKFTKNLSLMIDSIEYQLTYLYSYNRDLQDNLMKFCSLLVRLGKLEQALFYGQYAINEELTQLHSIPNKDCYSGFKSVHKSIQDVRISSFYIQLYKNHLNYRLLPKNLRSWSRLSIQRSAKRLFEHFRQTLPLDLEQLEKLISVPDFGISMEQVETELKPTYQLLLDDIRI